MHEFPVSSPMTEQGQCQSRARLRNGSVELQRMRRHSHWLRQAMATQSTAWERPVSRSLPPWSSAKEIRCRMARPCTPAVAVHILALTLSVRVKNLSARCAFFRQKKACVTFVVLRTPASEMAQGDVVHHVSTFKNRIKYRGETSSRHNGARSTQCTRCASSVNGGTQRFSCKQD
jgi:hypothetical protein